jgi:hypothetical protein
MSRSQGQERVVQWSQRCYSLNSCRKSIIWGQSGHVSKNLIDSWMLIRSFPQIFYSFWSIPILQHVSRPPPDPPGHRPQLGIPSALGDRPPPSPHHHRRQWPGWVCSCWNPCPTGWWNVARLWLERCPPKEDTKRKFRLSDVVMIWYSGKLLVNYIAMFLLVLYTIMTPLYKFHIQSYKM